MKSTLMKLFVFLVVIAAVNGSGGQGLAKICNSRCVPVQNCPEVQKLNGNEQSWFEENSCENPTDDEFTFLPGFSPIAKGDYVCCPHYNENKENNEGAITFKQPRSNLGKTQRLVSSNNKAKDHSGLTKDEESKYKYEKTYAISHQRRRPNQELKFDRFGSTTENPYFLPQDKNPEFDQRGRRNFRRNRPATSFEPTTEIGNNMPIATPSMSPVEQNPTEGLSRPQSSVGSDVTQCSDYSAYPADPLFGCCGLDATETDRVSAQQIAAKSGSMHDAPRAPNSRFLQRPSWMRNLGGPDFTAPRFKRSNSTVTIDNRISGGSATELGQFPWLLLLQVTFEVGDQELVVGCGASLISSRYVLTAAHCVTEEGGTLKDVQVSLSEYDKRSFPRDCVSTSAGQRCVDNVVIPAASIIRHPAYDDRRLRNDIALLRLRDPAPYTDYIRPICLPTINIDNAELGDMPLSVAGWGRNGTAESDLKQSAVMRLVPRQACRRRSYPSLSPMHMCAAGTTGQDTCKGDSGGPLMTLYEGRYYLSGVVSGKRADSPCGTTVPSLYTNVYLYREWIMSNIRD